MYLSSKEQEFVYSVGRSMTNSWPLIQPDNSPAQHIAGLRFSLISQRKDKPSTAARNFCSIILCKMRAEYPDVDHDYVVTTKLPLITGSAALMRLLPAYTKLANQSGPGSWNNRSFESVMNVFNLGSTGRLLGGTVFVFERRALAQLQAVYYTQERAALAAAPLVAEKQTVRSALAEAALIESESERKKLSRDARGTCYVCDAPKPRKVRCAVCGYMPRST
jgi:hypothetical protein